MEALPELGAVVDEAVSEWAPQLAPGTTLYAAMGARIAEMERGLLERSGISNLVERGMFNASEHVVTLVATGLIEGLIENWIENWVSVPFRQRKGFGPVLNRPVLNLLNRHERPF